MQIWEIFSIKQYNIKCISVKKNRLFCFKQKSLFQINCKTYFLAFLALVLHSPQQQQHLQLNPANNPPTLGASKNNHN